MTDWNDDFAARVNFAASYISGGKRTTRRFDSCFENYDGDQVAVALYRRTLARPDTNLAANLFRYLSRDSVMRAAEDLKDVRTPDLENSAYLAREKARRDFQELMAARRASA